MLVVVRSKANQKFRMDLPSIFISLRPNILLKRLWKRLTDKIEQPLKREKWLLQISQENGTPPLAIPKKRLTSNKKKYIGERVLRFLYAIRFLSLFIKYVLVIVRSKEKKCRMDLPSAFISLRPKFHPKRL